MCNFVIPIRTCSHCHHRERFFDKEDVRNWEPDNDTPTYIDPEQDCYSRWCVYSSEHPESCSSCWLTCKHWHGKTREIHGGTLSYVCRGCRPRRKTRSARNGFSTPIKSGGVQSATARVALVG
ncbi:hypothetical protein BV22DRAFT_1025756 [Leucogyrophana mollusca]|uniref:Uncharacterized protein n=1 Tax=Leucogyrophana mollusca TaxID=85980 RepID=A0ACB8AY38_9AGAM|nr:hypothetical protein BV22DRAFT_1025756 [Leucogyrophana mollusca]